MNVKVVFVSPPAALHEHYLGEINPQGVFIRLDLEDGELSAGPDEVVGTGVSGAEFWGRTRRYRIPALTADVANALLEELTPLAQRVLDDSEVEWDGDNWVAALGPDARDAEEEIGAHLGIGHGQDFELHELVGEIDPFDMVADYAVDPEGADASAAEYGITGSTTDEALDEICALITEQAGGGCASGVAVVPGLRGYLTDLRDRAQFQERLAAASARTAHGEAERSAGADDKAAAIAAEVDRRGPGGAAQLAAEIGVTAKTVSLAVSRARALLKEAS